MVAQGGDVIVVGGGVIGLAIAWRASTAGLAVTLVDPEPGRGASWAAAGMLAPVTEVHYGEEALLRLNIESSRRYPAFVRDLEAAAQMPVGYRPCGTVVVARDVDDNAVLDDLFAFQQRLGLDVERLRSRACRDVEPGLATTVRGGILVPGDHQVDNRALVDALRVAIDRTGVRIHRAAVGQVCTAGDRVVGVRCADGEELTGNRVVLAAGAWSGRIPGAAPEVAIPVRPVKGQLLHLRSPRGMAAVADHNVRGLDVYVVPRADGRLVVGATVEEQGFDTAATAGGVYELLRAAYELLPAIVECEFLEVAVGVRPGTPDNAPLLGGGAVDGLVVAAGHYRNGVLLTPVTADAVTDLLTGRAVPDVVAPFSPQRFAGRR